MVSLTVLSFFGTICKAVHKGVGVPVGIFSIMSCCSRSCNLARTVSLSATGMGLGGCATGATSRFTFNSTLPGTFPTPVKDLYSLLLSAWHCHILVILMTSLVLTYHLLYYTKQNFLLLLILLHSHNHKLLLSSSTSLFYKL